MKRNNMIKIIKGSAIIGSWLVMSELWYQIGKGRMLGIMRKYNLDAVDVLNVMNESDIKDDDIRIKLIKFISDMTRGIEP